MSNKNSKLAYYARAYASLYTPLSLAQWLMRRDLRSLEGRKDREEIMERVNYYCKLADGDTFDHDRFLAEATIVGETRIGHPSVYFLDSLPYARRVGNDRLWRLLKGDVTTVPDVPSIVKSRPIGDENANAVLLNLDKVRHFLFVDDRKPWREKQDRVIFRGLIGQCSEDRGLVKRNRYDFMQKFFGHPMFDIGVVDTAYPEWTTAPLAVGDHLDYKFIMSLEGNDVASNLKWVMSSNSIAVSPRPTCESWFMEGTLRPNYHYIECRPDYSDLEERLHYYIAHPDEAEAIIRHAHDYVARFRDSRRERIITHLVLQKYFAHTGM